METLILRPGEAPESWWTLTSAFDPHSSALRNSGWIMFMRSRSWSWQRRSKHKQGRELVAGSFAAHENPPILVFRWEKKASLDCEDQTKVWDLDGDGGGESTIMEPWEYQLCVAERPVETLHNHLLAFQTPSQQTSGRWLQSSGGFFKSL